MSYSQDYGGGGGYADMHRQRTAGGGGAARAGEQADMPTISVDLQKQLAPVRDYVEDKYGNRWANDGTTYVFMAFYAVANVIVFFERFFHYTLNEEAVFDLLGHGASVARGCGAALKLNCAFLLVPVLRNFLSWLRGTWVNNYVPIDKNIDFHRVVAYITALFGILHTMCHYFNFKNVAAQEDPTVLLAIGLDVDEAPTAGYLAFQTLPGSTGHVVSVIMIFMYTSAWYTIRRPMFEVFWYTHHLFVIFYGLLCFHGGGGLLEPPTFWLWFMIPGFGYLFERMMRILKGNQETILELAVQHPSRVIEVRLRKVGWHALPGMYVFVNCQYISEHEWHPFTLTSCPEEDFLSLHIRVCGDWTGDLQALLNPEGELGIVQENLLTAPDGTPIFRIDGPFGTASEEVFEYETVMLVGAGIGVTPFASILKSMRYRIERQQNYKIKVPIRKCYFFWLCRDRDAFEWFGELLETLERDNINNFLEIHTYLTGALRPDEIRNVMYGDEDAIDQITGLASPTHYGRPKWDDVFASLAQRHGGDDVGVFLCGPAALARELYGNCIKYTSIEPGGTTFHFKKENF